MRHQLGQPTRSFVTFKTLKNVGEKDQIFLRKDGEYGLQQKSQRCECSSKVTYSKLFTKRKGRPDQVETICRQSKYKAILETG